MKNKLREMTFAAVFTALTAIGAFIQFYIPPYPVPMTMQTAFIFLAGLLLSRRGAFFSQLTYVLLGLAGIPIFTRGGGIGYIFDPTFGYLLAFLFAAPAISIIAQKTLYKGRTVLYALFGFLIIAAIQICGVLYMLHIAGVAMAPEQAWYLFFIYLPLDIVKFIVMTALALQLRKRLSYLFAPSKSL